MQEMRGLAGQRKVRTSKTRKRNLRRAMKSFKVVDSRAPQQEFEEPTPQPTGTQMLIKVKAACGEERASRFVQKIRLNGALRLTKPSAEVFQNGHFCEVVPTPSTSDYLG
jgi:hypothetical protein